MPSPLTPIVIPGYTVKREAADQYRRSHRSLTRDIVTAMNGRDQDVLDNLLLLAEDGRRYIGADLSLALVVELRKTGADPLWYLRTSWLEQKYGRRVAAQKRPQSRAATKKVSVPRSDEGGEASTSREIVDIMQARIDELERDRELFQGMLKDTTKRDERRDQRDADTNELMREMHQWVKSLLPEKGDGQNQLSAPPRNNKKQVTDAEVIELPPSSTGAVHADPKQRRARRRRAKEGNVPKTSPTKKSPKKPASRKKQKAQKDARPKKQTTAPRKKAGWLGRLNIFSD